VDEGISLVVKQIAFIKLLCRKSAPGFGDEKLMLEDITMQQAEL
jgi:hypothetical protein